jgi:hypothetical protein
MSAAKEFLSRPPDFRPAHPDGVVAWPADLVRTPGSLALVTT